MMLDIVLYTLIIIILCLGMIIIHLWKTYRDRIAFLNEAVENLQIEHAKLPTLDLATRMKLTTDMFALIDMLIEYEILNHQKYDIFVKSDPVIDFDVFVEDISKTVFKSLNPNIFYDKNQIVNEKCIMIYITRRTIHLGMDYVRGKVEGEQ